MPKLGLHIKICFHDKDLTWLVPNGEDTLTKSGNVQISQEQCTVVLKYSPNNKYDNLLCKLWEAWL